MTEVLDVYVLKDKGELTCIWETNCFKGNMAGDVWKSGWHICGLSQEVSYHLELTWPELVSFQETCHHPQLLMRWALASWRRSATTEERSPWVCCLVSHCTWPCGLCRLGWMVDRLDTGFERLGLKFASGSNLPCPFSLVAGWWTECLVHQMKSKTSVSCAAAEKNYCRNSISIICGIWMLHPSWRGGVGDWGLKPVSVWVCFPRQRKQSTQNNRLILRVAWVQPRRMRGLFQGMQCVKSVWSSSCLFQFLWPWHFQCHYSVTEVCLMIVGFLWGCWCSDDVVTEVGVNDGFRWTMMW